MKNKWIAIIITLIVSTTTLLTACESLQTAPQSDTQNHKGYGGGGGAGGPGGGGHGGR
ncbi:MAG: hypothetical protein H0U70_05035 [Tatlockia sp.]|nr:hypothetical protein [Tatlockia sp.]